MPIFDNMHIKPTYYVNKFKFKFLYVAILRNVINQGSRPYYFQIFFLLHLSQSVNIYFDINTYN